MAENILLNETYAEVIEAVQREAQIEDRSPTKMATILIMEAIRNREAKRSLTPADGNRV